jgi:hypothetical protein
MPAIANELILICPLWALGLGALELPLAAWLFLFRSSVFTIPGLISENPIKKRASLPFD